MVSTSEQTNKFFSKSFTTKRKTSINISRTGSIVKERCRQLSEIALDLSPDRKISEEDLAFLVQRYIGADKETIRAYLGYYGKIRHGRSGEGYVVGLSRKGYLEGFGFMHRSGRIYIIHAQVKLPTGPIPYQDNEESTVFKENISISQGERARENRFEKVVSVNDGRGYSKGGKERRRRYKER